MTRSKNHVRISLTLGLVLMAFTLTLLAQDATSADSVVPRLINFSGKILDPQGRPLPGVAGVNFAVYKDQEGGAPLWMETQNVQADKAGHYTVQLGASKSTGLPSELFVSGEARWLGVQIHGQSEQPRTLLLSVPYALKALDAETLGGKPISSFMLAPAPGQKNANSANSTAAIEQANEIICTSTTGCKTGFLPLFASNGGSAKVADSIAKQSGTTLTIAGNESATGNISAVGNLSANNLNVNLNVGARTVNASAPNGAIFGTMTAPGNNVAAVTGAATAAGDAGFTFGVWGTTASNQGRAVVGQASGNSAVGVIGEIVSGGTGLGVQGKALPGGAGQGVWGESYATAGSNGFGPDGVDGIAHNNAGSGVFGTNLDSNGIGVYGAGNAYGVYGASSSPGGSGLGAINTSTGDAFLAYNQAGGWAGFFVGDVDVDGNLSKAGGSFKIDHPLDPANKYLFHSFVESPDMMNIYNGNVITDAQGHASVRLPDWFESLNRDFRYQLTVIGQFAQAMVAGEIANGQFTIQTDKPNVKVSWQVTGVRQDAWANAHRIPVEVAKPDKERGFYLHPELFGASASRSIAHVRHPEVEKMAQRALNRDHKPSVQ